MRGCLAFWLAYGNLNNGANAGLSYLNGNNGLSNANWNYLARLSKELSLFIFAIVYPRCGETGEQERPVSRDIENRLFSRKEI